MEKGLFLLREIAEQYPGMGLIDFEEDDITAEGQKEFIWHWFHVKITEPLSVECGTYLYIYPDSVDFEFRTKPDYDLINEDGDEIMLYRI